MSTPEIITVNSEALEAQIRDLLPSQRGFGSELQASNVIMPIIDLTATAEGSGLPDFLQKAMSFGSQSSFELKNATNTVVASGGGFFEVFGSAPALDISKTCGLNLFDGSTAKIILETGIQTSPSATDGVSFFNLIVFLNSGDSLRATNTSTTTEMHLTVRQIATITGTLVVPNGFVVE